MQFKVPQDVLRADKIVGFLTLRQLAIVTIGGGITYSLYIVLTKQYGLEIWLVPVVFMGLITAAFAFFKFHDIVFEKFVLLFIEYNLKPRKRTWQKMKGDFVLSVLAKPIGERPKTQPKKAVLTPEERREKLEKITKVVDSNYLKTQNAKIKNQNEN